MNQNGFLENSLLENGLSANQLSASNGCCCNSGACFCCCRCDNQRDCEGGHDHEVTGTVMLATGESVSHTHRFATISGPPIASNNSHVHEVRFRTDSAGHSHEFDGRTGFAIMVSQKDHVHFLESVTTTAMAHQHRFEVASLIQNPLDLCIIR